MISKEILHNSITEIKSLLLKMEEVSDTAPLGSLRYKSYPSGKRVPYFVSGPRGHQKATRIDPADRAFLETLQRKMFVRKVLPVLKKSLKALESACAYEPIELYSIAAQMGPEFRACADHFLGKNRDPKANPAFDRLEERTNVYDFPPDAVTTDLGVFRTKNEGFEAEILASLGVQFKYEVTILVGKQLMNVDFIVNLYWKNQIGIIEHHGLLDDPKYRKNKLEDLDRLMANGFYPGQNLLIISDSKTHGFDVSQVRRLFAAFCLPPEEAMRKIANL